MRKYFLLLLLACCSFMATAVEVDNLYRAKVEVASQSNRARTAAIKNAFETVIVKISGQKQILAQAEFKQAVSQYNHYLIQYAYERDQNGLALVARFDEDKVNQLFLSANQAIWGKLRPQVVVWLVQENGFERSLLAETQASDLPSAIYQFSQNRGLPLKLPLIDMVDSQNIDVIDVWGRFAEPIVQASTRYNAEAVVVMRLSNSSLLPLAPQTEAEQNCQPLCNTEVSDFSLDWSLISGTSQRASYFGDKYLGQEPKALVTQALDEIVQILLKDYALESQLNNEFVIDVANVDSMASYVSITQFLTTMSAVQNMMLVRAEGDNRRFKLQLLGSKQAFLSSLKLNKQLQQYIDPLAPVSDEQVPLFYWKHE